MSPDISMMLIISLLLFWYFYRVARYSMPDSMYINTTPSDTSYTLGLYIDPPSGWMYGFPKQVSVEEYESGDFNLRQWLIDNDYPEEHVDFALKHCRVWFK